MNDRPTCYRSRKRAGAIFLFAAVLMAASPPVIAEMLYVSSSGPGTVVQKADKQLYAAGEAVHLSAVPEPFAQFLRWSDGITEPEREVKIVGDDLLNFRSRFPLFTNIYLAYFTNNLSFQETIQVETNHSITIPHQQNDLSIVPIENDVLLWSTNANTLTRLRNDGSVVWSRSTSARSILPRPDGTTWVGEASGGYRFSILNPAGKLAGERNYTAEGGIHAILESNGGAVLFGLHQNLGDAEWLVRVDANGERIGDGLISWHNSPFNLSTWTGGISVASDGGYFGYEIYNAADPAESYSTLIKLDSAFRPLKELIFPWLISSGIALSDGKFVAIATPRHAPAADYIIVLISREGEVIWEKSGFGSRPQVFAGDQGDFWALRYTATGSKPAIGHYSWNGDLLSELAIDSWDGKSAGFQKDRNRPNSLRVVGLSSASTSSNQAFSISILTHRLVPARETP
jgi:hypothetical protein